MGQKHLMTPILAIDPGLRGALGFLFPDDELWVADTPTLSVTRNGKERDEVDIHALSQIIADCARLGAHAWVEKVGPMPTDGAVGAFAFGKVYGVTLGLLAAHQVPMTLVTPPVWKKAMGLSKQDKDASRARASELLPQHATKWLRKKDDGRAEAALLALYGRRMAT